MTTLTPSRSPFGLDPGVWIVVVAVLLIVHDMDLVFSFAARITVLVNGAVLTDGSPAEIAGDPRVKAVYLGDAAVGTEAAHA